MTAARPPAWDVLEAALRQRRPVRLVYHGRLRTICPHALGWKNDKAMLLAYQGAQPEAGPAVPAPSRGWRNLLVEEISDVALAGTGWETAENYNASHPFNSIDTLVVAVA